MSVLLDIYSSYIQTSSSLMRTTTLSKNKTTNHLNKFILQDNLRIFNLVSKKLLSSNKFF